MEAANLGAMLASHDERDIDRALILLRQGNERFKFEFQNVEAASNVRKEIIKEVDGAYSIGVPTWLYGHVCSAIVPAQ